MAYRVFSKWRPEDKKSKGVNVKKFIVAGVIVSAALLTGCNDKICDTDYWFAHQDEAKQTLEKCKSGEMANQNCDNARAAISKQKRLDWDDKHSSENSPFMKDD